MRRALEISRSLDVHLISFFFFLRGATRPFGAGLVSSSRSLGWIRRKRCVRRRNVHFFLPGNFDDWLFAISNVFVCEYATRPASILCALFAVEKVRSKGRHQRHDKLRLKSLCNSSRDRWDTRKTASR
ncbi:hypothetical protein F5I97DRAFT_1122003 [Phlebopus sp. FC_14]|nr:hypothetical protein F5I97DRAFT_1122003 [Phlebopus sp. FC_14]